MALIGAGTTANRMQRNRLGSTGGTTSTSRERPNPEGLSDLLTGDFGFGGGGGQSRAARAVGAVGDGGSANLPDDMESFPGMRTMGEQAQQAAGAAPRTAGRSSTSNARSTATTSGPQNINQDVWSRAAGGRQTTTTTSPNGNLTNVRSESPLGLGDLAQQALGDVRAQQEAHAEERSIAQEALQGVRDTYNEANTRLRGQIDDSRNRLRDQDEWNQDRVQGRFDTAAGMIGEGREFAEGLAGEQSDLAQQFRDEQLTEFDSQFALRHDSLRRSMERSYQNELSSIDRMVATGQMQASGGRSALEVAGAAKAERTAQYQDQLRAMSGNVAVEASRLEAQVRQSADQMALGSIGQANQMASGAYMTAAQTMEQLARDESYYTNALIGEQRQMELGLLQADLAAQQLAISEPQLATEIMMSSQFMPAATVMYPIMKELYDAYALQDAQGGGGGGFGGGLGGGGGTTNPFGQWGSAQELPGGYGGGWIPAEGAGGRRTDGAVGGVQPGARNG